MRLSKRGELEDFTAGKLLEMVDKRRHDPSIISLGGGATSLSPPQEMIHSLFSKLKNNPYKYSTYTPVQGIYTLRNKISKNLEKYGVKVSPEQVVITDGGTEAMFIALAALFDAGDEVLVQDPTYLNYGSQLKVLGLKAKLFQTRMEKYYQIEEKELRKQFSKRTKGIIIASPNNPTGTVLSKPSVMAVARFAKKHRLWIICDEACRSLIFEGSYEDIQRHAPKNCVNVASFSHVASSPGLRLGYAYGPSEAIERMVRVKGTTSFCTNSWSQTAAQEFFKVKEDYKEQVLLPTYRKRRAAIAAALGKYLPDAKWLLPLGGIYIFIDMSSYLKGRSEVDAADELFKRQKVVVTPGRGFGPSGKGYWRLTFAAEEVGKLEEGVRRIARFFK